MAPKFSIIVGYYNQERYLPNLIEAFNRQTFTDFEVIICDDGSDENPEDLILQQDLTTGINFPIKVVRQSNRGMRLAKSLNNGIKIARGEYCVFIMGDSFPESNYLEVLNEFADGINVVCGVRINIDGKRIVEIDYRLRKEVIPKQPVLLSANPWLSTTGNGLAIPTEALKRTGGWCEKIKGYGGDDNEVIARMYYMGYLIWSVPQMLLYHHWHLAKETEQGNNRKVNKMISTYYVKGV